LLLNPPQDYEVRNELRIMSQMQEPVLNSGESGTAFDDSKLRRKRRRVVCAKIQK
jgi:hypothetical protein